MNPELLKMLNAINAKKVEAKQLVLENKMEEAKTAKAELEALQNKFDIAKDLFDEQEGAQQQKVANQVQKVKVDDSKKGLNAFVNLLKSAVTRNPVNEDDLKVYNMMTEGDPDAQGLSDGGLTVPKDIRTQVKELRRAKDALEPLVNVEPVTTLSGSRNIEVNADQVPFDNVEEAAQFPDVDTPKFKNIAYKVLKKGGILKVTRELLQDSAENILGYLRKWIAQKARVTRNFLILAELDKSFGGSKVKELETFDDFKDIFNVDLDPAIALSSGVLTNQDGFNWLDKQKDSDGKYILQPNPVNATQKLLFGRYPVTVVSNKVLKSGIEGTAEAPTAHKYPFYMGDFKEAITIFDRETLSIEFSTEAGDLWGKDLTGAKVRERLDIKTVDEEAVIKGEVTVTV
ncbi:phage major capsid protein [Priestia aryabhattai]|uniref:Phage major capsid protein n=1 Tax=Priestia aryabhattai TaxID=412384 RepID=A0ABD7X4N9_PRIAR|nr:phage major capsid protein [Priestia aryabhattai]WEA47282.1 phage major capsid protein [Priestia aryabhattai]